MGAKLWILLTWDAWFLTHTDLAGHLATWAHRVPGSLKFPIEHAPTFDMLFFCVLGMLTRFSGYTITTASFYIVV